MKKLFSTLFFILMTLNIILAQTNEYKSNSIPLIKFADIEWNEPTTIEGLNFTYGEGTEVALGRNIIVLKEAQKIESSSKIIAPITLAMAGKGGIFIFKGVDDGIRSSFSGTILMVGDTLLIEDIIWRSQNVKGTAIIRNKGLELIPFK